MKYFKNIDTGEIWSEEEIRTDNNLRNVSNYTESNYKEYIEQYIESNDLRIRNLRENIIRDLECIVHDITAETEAVKNGKDPYAFATLISGTQRRLLDTLAAANRIQVLETQSEAFRTALQSRRRTKGE